MPQPALQPTDDELAALETLLRRARDRSYWASLLPEASIGGQALPQAPKGKPVDGRTRSRMVEEGWTRGGTVLVPSHAQAMRTAIETVKAAGWPTVFAFVYDALWAPTRLPGLQQFVKTVLNGPYKLIPDFWAYHIDVDPQAHGYRPHREAVGNVMLPEGGPLSITTWIPLTDASPDNGCMYVLPQNLDLGKVGKEQLEHIYGDNVVVHGLLHRARALPAKAGTVLSWNHAIKHWGGFSSRDATHPRVSVAFEFIRSDRMWAQHEHTKVWEHVRPRAPGILDLDGPLPTFEQRLYLIGRNMKRYLDVRTSGQVYQWMADVFLLGGYKRFAPAGKAE